MRPAAPGLGKRALLAPAAPAQAELGRLRQLSTLTPGDFAAVARQHRFRPVTSCASFVAALEQECSVKQKKGSLIGFLA